MFGLAVLPQLHKLRYRNFWNGREWSGFQWFCRTSEYIHPYTITVDNVFVRWESWHRKLWQAERLANRDLLNTKLSSYKQEKWNRSFLGDYQLITFTQEEIKIEKQLLEKMGDLIKEHCRMTNRLTTNTEKPTNSIAEEFANLAPKAICKR